MAKHGKPLPARRQRDRVEGSLLIRSAESLGRVIGSLQRQLDGATKRLADTVDDVAEELPFSSNGNGSPRTRSAKTTRTATTKSTKNAKASDDRPSKRASKSTAVKRSAGRSGPRKAKGA